jgi:hypothetical protein
LDTGEEGVDGLRHAEINPEDPMTILFREYSGVTQDCISFWTVLRSEQNTLAFAVNIYAKDVPEGIES